MFISERLTNSAASTSAPAAHDATGISHSRDAGKMRRVWTETLPQVAMKYITSPTAPPPTPPRSDYSTDTGDEEMM